VEGAEIMRMAYEAHQDDNDFIQPGTLYRQVMTPTDRDHLVANIVGPLSQGVERVIHADNRPRAHRSLHRPATFTAFHAASRPLDAGVLTRRKAVTLRPCNTATRVYLQWWASWWPR
jgi:Catalase-related immune-responsive